MISLALLTLCAIANALNLGQLNDRTRALQQTNAKIESAPTAQQQQLTEQRGRIVEEIRDMADSERRLFRRQTGS